MTDEQLNEWAARVQELEVKKGSMGFLYLIERGKYHCGKTTRQGDRYDPITNGQQAMDLQVAFNVAVTPICVDEWMAWTSGQHPESEGNTPNKAIVRAAIASVYGEFVETEEED